MTRSRLLAYFFLLINTVVWGLALPIAKKGFVQGLSPTTFLLARYFVAAFVSLPLIFFLPKTQLKKAFSASALFKIIPLEVLGTVLALFLLYEGVKLTTAVGSTLIAMTWPVFITIGGILFLKEKEERHEWLGLGLALVGTFLLVVKPLLTEGVNGNTKGNLLILAETLIIAVYYILVKKHYHQLNKFLVTHLSFWVGLVGFALISRFQGQSLVGQATFLLDLSNPWPLIAVLYMAIAGSIIGATTYLLGQDKIEASEASLFTYLQPIFAVPTAMILLAERISYLEIGAAVIIIIGVILAEKR